ncbi:MAG TPA: sulfotransferase [Acidimicrobiales bacterium]
MTTLVGQVFGSLPASVRRLVPVELQADLRDRYGQWEPGDIGFEPDAPTAARGERTGPPDFIVLGPAECGARWWMSLIADHPGVAPTHSVDGAAHVFDRYCTEGFGDGEIARFHAFFPRRPGRIVGHWSADGLSYPWIAPLLARAAPGAKIIVLVRDPVAVVMDRLAATAGTRRPSGGADLADAVDRGFFGAQLERLHDLFPAALVQVLQYEQCVSDAPGALARTYEFLGLGGSDRPVLPHPIGHVSGNPGDRLSAATRSRLQALYADDVARLTQLTADVDLARWPNFVPEH